MYKDVQGGGVVFLLADAYSRLGYVKLRLYMPCRVKNGVSIGLELLQEK